MLPSPTFHPFHPNLLKSPLHCMHGIIPAKSKMSYLFTSPLCSPGNWEPDKKLRPSMQPTNRQTQNPESLELYIFQQIGEQYKKGVKNVEGKVEEILKENLK